MDAVAAVMAAAAAATDVDTNVDTGAQAQPGGKASSASIETQDIDDSIEFTGNITTLLLVSGLAFGQNSGFVDNFATVSGASLDEAIKLAQIMALLNGLFSQMRLPESLLKSYVLDWLVTLASMLVWMYLSTATPHYQAFSVDDKSISYPYVPPNQQTVTVPVLVLIAIVIPAAIITGISLGLRKNTYDLHVGVLGLLMGVSLTLMFTDVLKNVVGRPRPNLLARCLPVPPNEPLRDPPQGLSTISICTQENIAVLNEGFRSFPSGHTSLSFAGMTYLTFYLAGKLHLFDGQGHSYKPFVVFMPLLVAAIVGATRVADYWHHPTDVLFGAMIGIVTATFSYHQYYPVAISPHSDAPFDLRKQSSSPVLAIHAHTHYARQQHSHSSNEQNHISLNITDHSPRPRALSANAANGNGSDNSSSGNVDTTILLPTS
ncbi:hypothetical protein LPJ81_001435 [Coemansia sp. IMI 209127]|nr:hypothetical protein LPJ81_001435 [Coemansia sp. IMI 209127]